MGKSKQLLYERAKCVSLACAILCAESATAQTPLVAAPATPATLNPSPAAAPAGQSGARPFTASLPVPSTLPALSGPNASQPTVVNRYNQQVQRPAFIPFDPNTKPAYNATSLPPPTGSTAPASSTTAQNLIDAFPVPSAQTTNQRSGELGLPGANQLMPRNPVSIGATQLQQNQTSFRPNELPPFQGAVTGQGVLGQGLPPLPNLPLPNLMGAQSDSKTIFTGFDSNTQIGATKKPEVTTDLWNARLVAVVGTERVLAGDMAAIVEPIINENKAKLPNKQQENEARNSLIRQLLPQYTEMKALQQEFFRDIAGNVPPKELQKKQDEIMTRASKAFYDKFVPVELYKKHKVENVADLENKLQENGLSLAIMKNHFLMQILAMQLEDKYVADTFEISPGEILAYYNANIEKWQIPARAKWRQLTVRFDRNPNRADAENKIKTMGNEVVLGGKPFEAVARDSSEGFSAEAGGLHDWTTKGSLKSTVIDEALFKLPPRRLSQIIEDDVGLHIVEVLEREAARTQDMSEIQAEIRKKLSDDVRQQKLKEFRKKVLDRVPIWTIWPEDIPGSRPLNQAIAEAKSDEK